MSFRRSSCLRSSGFRCLAGKRLPRPRRRLHGPAELNTPVFVVKAQIHAAAEARPAASRLRRTRRLLPVWQGTDRQDPDHAPDRSQGPESAPVADRRRGQHRQRIVSEHPRRSGYRLADVYRQHRRRDGNRRSRGKYSGEDHQGSDRSRPSDFRGTMAAMSRSPSGFSTWSRPSSIPSSRCSGNLYRLFMEKNAAMVEINPLIITEGKETGRAGRQGLVRRQRAVQA